VVGGDERVYREQAEGRRAVDQDHVLAALEVTQRASQRDLAADLARKRQLGLGEPHVRRDHRAVDRLGRAHLAVEHLGEGGRRLGVGVEVVGEIALRVGVDRQHVEPEAAEDVAERSGHRRLARPPLLGEDRDRGRHWRRSYTRPQGPAL
jgi:hypothetical protein